MTEISRYRTCFRSGAEPETERVGDMNRQYKYEFGAFGIVGAVFTFVGAVFTILGTAIGFLTADTDRWLLLMIFGGMGLLFLVIGIIFLTIVIRTNRRRKEVLEKGYYIYADVMDSFPDMHVRINRIHPYRVRCRYQDPATGQYHMFTGGMFLYDPEPMIRGRQVPVYLDPADYDTFYIDFDSIMPDVQEHKMF